MPAPTLFRPDTTRTATSRTDLSRPPSLASTSRWGQAQARIVAPDLRIADGAAGSVFRAAADRGPLSREEIAKATGLSIATVNRQVSALLAAGVVSLSSLYSDPLGVMRRVAA